MKGHVFGITMIDAAALFIEYRYYTIEHMIYSMAGAGTKDGDPLRVFMAAQKPDNSPIRVEVLNASGEAGGALIITRMLRAKGIDVQQWDTYSIGREQKTMIIDRTGALPKAFTVAQCIDCTVVFSRNDPSRFVDVSVIIGEDMKEKIIYMRDAVL